MSCSSISFHELGDGTGIACTCGNGLWNFACGLTIEVAEFIVCQCIEDEGLTAVVGDDKSEFNVTAIFRDTDGVCGFGHRNIRQDIHNDHGIIIICDVCFAIGSFNGGDIGKVTCDVFKRASVGCRSANCQIANNRLTTRRERVGHRDIDQWDVAGVGHNDREVGSVVVCDSL